jgi:type II secretory pathway component PulF
MNMIRLTTLERGEVRTIQLEEVELRSFQESLCLRGGMVLRVERINQSQSFRLIDSGPEGWAYWYSALARTLKGGVPLDQALDLLADAAPKRDEARKVHQDIVAGKHFSDSVQTHFRNLPPLVPALLKAGEAAGDLSRGAGLVYQCLQDQASFRRELSARLAYPLVVVSFSALALIVLLLKVFPAMEGMWSTLNKPLPPLLTAMQVFGWVAVLGLICLALGFGWLMGGSEKAQKLPGFKTLGRHRSRGEAWSALSMALGGGVSLIDSLQLFGERWGSRGIKESIQKGERPEVALAIWVDDAPGQKAVLIASLRIGDLAGGAQGVADGYRELLEQDLRALQRWLEPSVLILLGGILLGLAWSLFSLMGQMEHGLAH